jgi:hypothetical protein
MKPGALVVAADRTGDGNFSTGEAASAYILSMGCQKIIIAR